MGRMDKKRDEIYNLRSMKDRPFARFVRSSMLLVCVLLAYAASAQQTTHLQGRVYLNDTLPAAYATLYLPQYGIGTVTDDQGNYQMDDIPVGPSVLLEYSYLGYATERVKVALTEPNHRYAHDQRLREQAIQLGEVYLTPNGEDPCIYILRKLHEQGVANRKRLVSYKAVCNGSIHLQNLDIVPAVLSKFLKTMMHGLLRTFGFNAIFNYVTSSRKVDVEYQYTQEWNNGKVKNSEMKILAANPEVSDKVRRQMKIMQSDNFFEQFYGEKKKFDAKKVAQRGWSLKGVIEENGQTIDVLKRATVSDSMRVEFTCYIIEDLWSVLRFESRGSNGSISRYECRDIGGGIYLPVSFVTNPMPIDVDKFFANMKREYEAGKAKGESGKMEKNMIERYEKATRDRGAININFITPYSITYSGVSVK